MTVSGTTNLNQYIGDGAATVFARTFLVTDFDHLKVYTTTSGVTTEVTTGITKDGEGTASGNVTFATAPASGTTVLLIRETPLTQETDYVSQGKVDPEVIEDDLDAAVMRIQDIQETLGRSLRLPAGQTLNEIVLVDGRALFYDAATNSIVAGPSAADLTGPQGPEGDAGPAGADGADGQDGADGINGADGQDGTSVTVSVVTQAEYDALSPPDANTLYVVSG